MRLSTNANIDGNTNIPIHNNNNNNNNKSLFYEGENIITGNPVVYIMALLKRKKINWKL